MRLKAAARKAKARLPHPRMEAVGAHRDEPVVVCGVPCDLADPRSGILAEAREQFHLECRDLLRFRPVAALRDHHVEARLLRRWDEFVNQVEQS